MRIVCRLVGIFFVRACGLRLTAVLGARRFTVGGAAASPPRPRARLLVQHPPDKLPRLAGVRRREERVARLTAGGAPELGDQVVRRTGQPSAVLAGGWRLAQACRALRCRQRTWVRAASEASSILSRASPATSLARDATSSANSLAAAVM